MSWFFSWYLIATALGWLAFPLTFRLFPALPERGYTFARSAGLLIWGYVFWLLTSLGLAQNDMGGLLLGILILSGLSIWAFATGKEELIEWVKANARLIRGVEILFLLAFAFLAFLRASNPELTSAEKPMELMFINAILRSPNFPPRDAWLSGYAISYYYFGYIMAAMLAKLSGVPGSAAHNLMTALVFALAALGAYGILYNLLAVRRQAGGGPDASPGLCAPILGPLFLLLVSNIEGFLEILHRRGLFWQFASDGSATSTFWTWMDIKDLSQPPSPLPGGLWARFGYWWSVEGVHGIDKWFNEQFAPTRYLWWWRASRVVQDYDLSGTFREIIDEFPFFSFLHADLHPHVLAIPFGLLAIGIALHIYLGGWRGKTEVFGHSLYISKPGFFFIALTLGGLAFLNTWDILISAVLIIGAYLLVRIAAGGWGWKRLEEAVVFGLPLAVLSFLLYLPFYLGFSSQLGGILPNLVYPTRGVHLWVMFATLWLPLIAYLLFLWRSERIRAHWRTALILSIGFVVLLWVLSWVLGLAISWGKPEDARLFLDMQGVPDLTSLFDQATPKRLATIGGLLTLLGLLVPALAFLLGRGKREGEPHGRISPNGFILLLIGLAALLVIGPEFLYLRDQFGTRINTIFKFYYQAWMLWSLAAAFGVAVLLRSLQGARKVVFTISLALLLLVGLTYPYLGVLNRTDGFRLARAWELLSSIRLSQDEQQRDYARSELASLWTLDYFDYVQRQTPDEAAAIRWLQSAPDGVVAEAVGGSYSGYARVSTYTGLPTVLGWPGHESQWRGGYKEQGARQMDIQTLYAATEWETAREILERYQIRYVYVGSLERMGPEPLQEAKFARFLHLAFQQGDVTIYEVP